MSTERLLKRIRTWSENEDASSEVDLEAFINSVLADLEKVYNTRQGTVVTDEKFGLPDFTSLMNTMSPPEIEDLGDNIEDATMNYDQRIKNAISRYQKREDDMGVVRFSITAKLQFRDQLIPLSYDALLQGDGSVSINRAS